MMNIAIDCRALTWKRSGIARYLFNILQILFAKDNENNYYLLTPCVLNKNFKNSNVHSVIIPGNFFSYKFFHTPKFLKEKNMSVYWSPTQELPLRRVRNCKYVISMHDIANEFHKEWMSWNIRIMTYAGLYRRSAQTADTILAVSNSVKKDIEAFYHVNPEKVNVTYEGYDPFFQIYTKKKAQEYVKKKFNITGQYIFYISTVQAKELVTAFANLLKHEWLNKDITLICLGKFVIKKQNPVILAKEFGISKQLLNIEEFVSDEDVNYLYSGSEFFVSPALYEGFGLTPLEALRSGTAIAISDIPTHREVFKDIPLYFDPFDQKDIKEKMFYLYKNEKEKKRMLSQAEKLYALYNWEKAGKKVYQSLLE